MEDLTFELNPQIALALRLEPKPGVVLMSLLGRLLCAENCGLIEK